jgi:negative regulator of genetic competence, sporulation and motility
MQFQFYIKWTEITEVIAVAENVAFFTKVKLLCKNVCYYMYLIHQCRKVMEMWKRQKVHIYSSSSIH